MSVWGSTLHEIDQYCLGATESAAVLCCYVWFYKVVFGRGGLFSANWCTSVLCKILLRRMIFSRWKRKENKISTSSTIQGFRIDCRSTTETSVFNKKHNSATVKTCSNEKSGLDPASKRKIFSDSTFHLANHLRFTPTFRSELRHRLLEKEGKFCFSSTHLLATELLCNKTKSVRL